MSIVGRGSTSNYYSITNNSTLNFPNADWAFWCWVFLTNFSSTGEEDAVATHAAQTAGNAGMMWRLMENTGATAPGKARITYRDDAAVNGTRVSTNDIPLNKPVLLLFQRRGADTQLQLWFCTLNGEPSKEDSVATGSFGAITSAIDWRVTCRNSSPTAPLKAGNEVWGVGKADVSFSYEQIRQLGTGINPTWIGQPLKLYLPFDQGAQSIALDISGNANHASLTGNLDTGYGDLIVPRPKLWIIGATASSPITVAPNPAVAAASTVNPTVVLGALSLAPAPAAAASATVNPTVVLGSLTIAPAPAASAGSTINPTVVLGAISIAPAPASAAAAVVDPTVALGALAIAPAPAAATATVVNPTVALGALSISPSPAAATAATVAPTVVLGSLSITPAPASAVATVVDPNVDAGGNVSVTPAPAAAAGTVVAPTVVLGALSITPGAVSASGIVVAPTVVLGALVIAPNPAAAATATVDPSIPGSGTQVSPAPASAAGTTVAPTVVLGSLAISPAAASAATYTSVTVLVGQPGTSTDATSTLALADGPVTRLEIAMERSTLVLVDAPMSTLT